MQLTSNNLLTTSKRVELLTYKPRPFIEYQEMTDADIFNGSGDIVFDSECFPNFYLCAFRSIQTGKVIRLIPPFDPRKLSFILHRYRCIGFNSLKYDLPLLWAAYQRQDLYWLKEVSNRLVGGTWYQEICKEYGIRIFETETVDLIEVCPLRGSLKLYGARLHTQRIQELPYHHMKELTNYEKEVVADYCINSDLPATAVLFSELKEQLDLRQSLSQEYKINVMSKSDAQIAESVIGTELKRLTGKWPKKPNIDTQYKFFYQCPQFIQFKTKPLNDLLTELLQFKYSVSDTGRLEYDKELSINIGQNVYRLGSGGLHSSEKNCHVVSNEEYEIVDRDVASYYPRIVLNLGLFPEHLGPNFLVVYNSIVERRLLAKKNKDSSKSECLKITINGTFGKTGSPYSFLYAPQMMIQITLTGQLGLLMIIEELELNDIPVYSANTDGIVIKCPRSKKDKLNEIFKAWEQHTGFGTEETIYKAVYSRDVNAYIAVKEKDKEGKVEVKGKNLYYDPWRGKGRDLYWRFQKNPQAQICVEAIERIIVNSIPIADTINNCLDITKFIAVRNVKGGAHKNREYLGKVIRYYWAKNEHGAIQYIDSGNKVPDTEGAKPLMDLPDELPTDIDYNWYIRRAKEMLYDIDFLRRPQQVRFF